MPRLFSLLASLGLLIAGVRAEPLPIGAGHITVDVGVPLEVFTYRPPTYTEGPLVIVLHGLQRNADDYRTFAISLAERFGAIVAAPQFDRERFPHDAYQLGGILAGDVAKPREQWTFSRLPAVVAELQRRIGGPARPYYFIGHSAGGQFLVRLAAMAGPLGAERIVAANPGSYLFPTRNAQYGYGFGGLPGELGNDDAIRRYLAAPLTLYLGLADNDPNHPSMDRCPEAQRQGADRHARGLACFTAAERFARERGWAFNWKRVEVTGIGHDAAAMFAAPEVEAALFGSSRALVRATP